jgi:hypothetical protein
VAVAEPGTEAIVAGTQSAGAGGGDGGSGSYLRASLALKPGETLTIRVGSLALEDALAQEVLTAAATGATP